MSALIKKMLAERERIAELDQKPAPKPDHESDEMMHLIDLAKPFIDENAPANKWPPSILLKIGYFVLATGDNPETAVPFVKRHLDVARTRFKAGLDPNPFLGRVS